MTWLLLPITLLTKSYLPLPSIFALIPTYILAIYLVARVSTDPAHLDLIEVKKKPLYYTLVLILLQIIVMLRTVTTMTHLQGTPKPQNGPLLLILTILSYFLVYYCVQLSIKNVQQVRVFLQSVFWTLIILLIFVLLPQLVDTLRQSHLLETWLNGLAKLFEAHHKGRPDFYNLGSYVATQHRINGFSQEASFLAAQLGIVFLPFIMASIKNHYDVLKIGRKFSQILSYILLGLIFLCLIFAKTTTGIIVLGISVIVFFLWNIRKTPYLTLIVTGIVVVIAVSAYAFVPYLHALIDSYVFEKQGVSNRLGSTIALLQTALHHPFVGVGFGYSSPYAFEYVPRATTNNFEFTHFFLKDGIAIQSEFFALFAQFGIILVGFVFYFFLGKVKKARKLHRLLVLQSDEHAQMYLTILDAFSVFIVMYTFLLFFSFSYLDMYYFTCLAFYLVSIDMISKEYIND